MKPLALDHIVLACRDVAATRDFYSRVLGLTPREEHPDKWSLVVGASKISLQDAAHMPPVAVGTLPGAANLCLLVEENLEVVRACLAKHGVAPVSPTQVRDGARGPILSFHIHDPDGNLVEIGRLE